MIGPADIDRPEVLAEVEAVFAEYEAALTGNDVATLDRLFLDRDTTIRYGGGEESLTAMARSPPSGRRARPMASPARCRAPRSPPGRPRPRRRLDPLPTGRRARQGRPPDADLGADAGGLADRRRPRLDHRRSRIFGPIRPQS